MGYHTFSDSSMIFSLFRKHFLFFFDKDFAWNAKLDEGVFCTLVPVIDVPGLVEELNTFK